MGSLLASISRGLDAVLQPLPPTWGLLLISLLTALLALVAYKYASPQRRIRRAKALLKAELMTMMLYKDSLGVALAASGKAFLGSFRYLALNLVPLVVLLLPISALLAGLDGIYGYQPLSPGQSSVLTVDLAAGRDPFKTPVTLAVPTGVVVMTPPVRVAQPPRVSWRLQVKASGLHQLQISHSGQTVQKTLTATGALVSARRHRGELFQALLHSGERPIPKSSSVDAISLEYRGAEIDLLGWKAHWLYPYFALVLLLALMLRRFFGVTF